METKILQFGEGNFLRGFFDWMVQRMNDRAGFDGRVQIIQPRGDAFKEVSTRLNEQGGRYHVCFRGLAGGREVEELEEISSVAGVDLAANLEKYATLKSLRFVISNTTEAGIRYAKGEDTFPAKVLRLLKARCAAKLPGLVIIPCELVEHNGDLLKRCILQHLADESNNQTIQTIKQYIEDDCVFCSTLVDRIVSGRPDPETVERYARELGARDEALICAEPFHFFAIEPPAGFDLEAELPLKRAGVNVVYADDIEPYRARKLRFLNAAHTSIVYWGIERGFEEVAQIVNDPEGNRLLRQILFEEIYPTLNLPEAEKTDYANSILERFANPFAHHKLASIKVNTLVKWRIRCLPIVCDYFKLFGRLPEGMMRGYEALARHYDNLSISSPL